MLSAEPPPGSEGTGVITQVENRKIKKNKKSPLARGVNSLYAFSEDNTHSLVFGKVFLAVGVQSFIVVHQTKYPSSSSALSKPKRSSIL